MIARLTEWITGKDDLERVAARGDRTRLNAYLETRRLWVPCEPSRFLDASDFGPDDLLRILEEEAEENAADRPFTPWVMEDDGVRRLPAFSSMRRMTTFAGAISKRLNKVFPLFGAEVLLDDAVLATSVAFVDLNPLCGQSWEIAVEPRR